MTKSVNSEEFQKYLHEQIPLSKAMELSVKSLSLDEVVLGAAFTANRNHKGTVFGGSLAAISTLSCWSLIYMKLSQVSGSYEIVVTQSNISYKRPVKEEIKAICRSNQQDSWDFLFSSLQKKGKGRIKLEAYIGNPDQPSVYFEGTFAVLRQER